ncbi:unnamed protein product, partial [Darwinula stevensoni]
SLKQARKEAKLAGDTSGVEIRGEIEEKERRRNRPKNLEVAVFIQEGFLSLVEHKVQGDIETWLRNSPPKWTIEQAKKTSFAFKDEDDGDEAET